MSRWTSPRPDSLSASSIADECNRLGRRAARLFFFSIIFFLQGMKPTVKSLLALLGALLPLTVHAATVPRTGLWKQTVTMSLLGGQSREQFDCISDADIRRLQSQDWQAGDFAQGCRFSQPEVGAHHYAATMRCDTHGQQGEGQMRIELPDPTHMVTTTHFEGTVQMAPEAPAMPMSLDVRIDGQWVAEDCGEYADDKP